MRRSSWTPADNAELVQLALEARATGISLTDVFGRVAEQSGRQPGSVRNHYYSLLRENGEKAAAYVPFSRSDTERLIRDMLVLISSGSSVRGAALELSHGDASLMLRYQNKYRTVCRSDPKLIEKVATENGLPYVSFKGRAYAGRRSASVGKENALAEKDRELKLAHERIVKLHTMFRRLFEMYRELADGVSSICSEETLYASIDAEGNGSDK